MKKTILSLSILCLTSLSAQAATKNNGYLTDTNGNIVKSASGLCVKTGFWTPADAVAECEPTVMKNESNIMPAPIPEVIQYERVQTPIPMTVRKTVSADILFGFDKFKITEQGKNALSQVIENNQRSEVTHIQIVGYTDPIGTEVYNQNLSEKRANSVKDYFINNGYATNIIHSEGKGEANLLITKNECSGEKLISCYAPNRRVEIEFVVERKN